MFLTPRGKKKAEDSAGVAISFERRLLVSILLAGLPGVVLAFVLLWTGPYSLDHQIEGTIAVLLLWLTLARSAQNIVVHSVRVLSNIVSGLREEDFSFRAMRAGECTRYLNQGPPETNEKCERGPRTAGRFIRP